MFLNLFISLENIFCIANIGRLYYTHNDTDKTRNHKKVFSCANKIIFSLGSNKLIS
jgi:hypothetical protein